MKINRQNWMKNNIKGKLVPVYTMKVYTEGTVTALLILKSQSYKSDAHTVFPRSLNLHIVVPSLAVTFRSSEICILLGYYTVKSANSLPTFQNNLLV
jgi:hypothetical protein